MIGAAYSLESPASERARAQRADAEQVVQPVEAPGSLLPEPFGKRRVLVVDEDDDLRAELEELLQHAGYDVVAAEDGVAALALYERHKPDLVVTELHPPRMGNWELLRWMRRQDAGLPIVAVSADPDWRTAVSAMREGARDYLVKPVNHEELSAAIERSLSPRTAPRQGIEPEPEEDFSRAKAVLDFGDLVGHSPAMQRLYGLAQRIAPSKATVLITGETGTGKGRLARAIHDASPRANHPFIPVQASAFVESLLESELFGHERGAFTGADHRRIGRFEQAKGGTLFLDEAGDMSHSVQVKLLRVLQERVLERVGGNETIPADVRVVAATSRDLRADVEQGRFREDLYYRLNVVHLEMPPLRVRGDDILLLAHAFLKRCQRENGKALMGFTPKAEAKLLGHAWAGNVRELENTIERAAVLCDGTQVDARHLDLELPHSKTPLQRLEEIEREAILSTLAATNSTARAAEVLGISVRTIQYRLKQYGLTGRRRRSW